MEYTINKTNYRDFSKIFENRLEHRSYFIPFRTREAMNDSDFLNEKVKATPFYCYRVNGILSTSRVHQL